ncbi:MAG: TRAP transporter small permease [Rhodospirillales bacterium]|nr:TRAP transporter small permease [Rhodospirillales bacterium]
MRTALDALYHASGGLAAVFLGAIAAIVLLQVGFNVTDTLSSWIIGEPIGLVIPSYAEFAGFFLASSSFLALAYSLRCGAHIRVSLLLQHLPLRSRYVAELWCCASACAFSGYFAWYVVLLVIDSYRFGDVSPGMVPVPLWLPQAAMGLGLVVLTVALLDTFLSTLRIGPTDKTDEEIEATAEEDR